MSSQWHHAEHKFNKSNNFWTKERSAVLSTVFWHNIQDLLCCHVPLYHPSQMFNIRAMKAFFGFVWCGILFCIIKTKSGDHGPSWCPHDIIRFPQSTPIQPHITPFLLFCYVTHKSKGLDLVMLKIMFKGLYLAVSPATCNNDVKQELDGQTFFLHFLTSSLNSQLGFILSPLECLLLWWCVLPLISETIEALAK